MVTEEASPKPAITVLVDRVAAENFQYDNDIALLQYGTNIPVTTADLETLHMSKQFRSLGTQCIANTGEILTVGAEPYPVRIDTGDPVNDDMMYDTAKALWIATYPGLYAHMNTKHDGGK